MTIPLMPTIEASTRKTSSIMVVDGSEVSRTIVSRILNAEMDRASITTCASGSEALTHLDQSRFDLITTALLLPDMDGLDLSRRIRKSSTHHYTPIVVVSGDADSRLLREGFEAGVTDYFDKSQGYQSFVEFIHAFTRRNSGLVGRILFVEDSKTTARHICTIMEKHGLQVTHTTHAEHALTLLQQANKPNNTGADSFDVVVTDFFLKGGMTGGDLLHAIRARLYFSQQELPVLVLTGSTSEGKQADVFHAGANDFVAKPVVEEVMMARLRSLLLVKQQYNALKRQADEMRRLATTDSLTGVRSKRYLLDNGEQFLQKKSNLPVSAMLMDIDHFKKINDKLGHITGDHVLAALGDLLNKCFDERCIVLRFGGEEFAVLVPCRNMDWVKRKAEEIRQKVEQLRPVNISVTVSIGLSTTRDAKDLDLTRLLANADKALYMAKENGRNRVCLFSECKIKAKSLATGT